MNSEKTILLKNPFFNKNPQFIERGSLLEQRVLPRGEVETHIIEKILLSFLTVLSGCLFLQALGVI